jgi:Protein of unknown function (DUF3015)
MSGTVLLNPPDKRWLESKRFINKLQPRRCPLNFKTAKVLVGAWVLVSAGLIFPGCNTTKATFDTLGKFTSSTSPSEWIDGDGVIQESQRARLFTAVVYENLEQDIARGNGEYLTSLGVLLKIPTHEQERFKMRSQSNYPLLFASDRRTAENLLATALLRSP